MALCTFRRAAHPSLVSVRVRLYAGAHVMPSCNSSRETNPVIIRVSLQN